MIGIPGSGAVAALTRLHERMSETVTVTGAGLPGATPLTAVHSNLPGDPFHGPGRTTRRTLFELRYVDLPQRPDKTLRIVDRDGVVWRPVDIVDRDDIAAWSIGVERAT